MKQSSQASSGDKPPSGSAAQADQTLGACRPTVLVIEDHHDMAAYIRRRLEPLYRVIKAARGDIGLHLATEKLPDLIVSDIMMPGMNGYALCRALKADPKLNFIPLILLTARGKLDDKLEGLDCGADEYLTKPFSSKELLARIRNLLRTRDQLRQHARQEAIGTNLSQEPTSVRSAEEKFLDQVQTVLEKRARNSSFDVDALAQHLAISRVHLHRRLKSLSQTTPSDLILGFRLEQAARLLAQNARNVSETAYAVGFKDLSHFVRRFRRRYGMTPSAYAAAHRSPPTEV